MNLFSSISRSPGGLTDPRHGIRLLLSSSEFRRSAGGCMNMTNPSLTASRLNPLQNSSYWCLHHRSACSFLCLVLSARFPSRPLRHAVRRSCWFLGSSHRFLLGFFPALSITLVESSSSHSFFLSFPTDSDAFSSSSQESFCSRLRCSLTFSVSAAESSILATPTLPALGAPALSSSSFALATSHDPLFLFFSSSFFFFFFFFSFPVSFPPVV